MSPYFYQKLQRESVLFLLFGSILSIPSGLLCVHSFTTGLPLVIVIRFALYGTLGLCGISLLRKGFRARRLCRASRAYHCWFTAGGVADISEIAAGLDENADSTLKTVDELLHMGMFPDVVLWAESGRVHCPDVQVQEGIFQENCIDRKRMNQVRTRSLGLLLLAVIGAVLSGFYALGFFGYVVTRTLSYILTVLYLLAVFGGCCTVIFHCIMNLRILGKIKRISSSLKDGSASISDLAMRTKLQKDDLLKTLRHIMRQGYFYGMRIDMQANCLRFTKANE